MGIRRDLAPREDTRVDGLPHARDGVKVHLVAGDFSGHEHCGTIRPAPNGHSPCGRSPLAFAGPMISTAATNANADCTIR